MSENNPISSIQIEPLMPGRSDPSRDLFLGTEQTAPPATIEEARFRIETLERELEATREDVRRLRDQAAQGNLPVEPAPAASESPESPELELQMDDAVIERVETRNLFQRVRDSIVERFDPRDKDWTWRIAAAVGIGEAVVASTLIPGPFGRMIASAGNFLLAQGIHFGVGAWRQVEISHVRGDFSGNELVQRILDINEKHKVASDRIKNAFAGLSAGMTVGSIGTLVYGAVEGFIAPQPTIAAPVAEIPNSTTRFVPPIELPHTASPDIFNPAVAIPDNGNFWTAWHIDSSSAVNWTDLHNGTTHTDVIKDMVVKLARANGHELGIVHAGDQIDLGKVLTAEQLELVKKAAKAKSYQEYLSGVRLGYLSFLKK